MEMQKKLPIGIERFEEIRKQDFYYIDKTGLIKELLHNCGKVNLFTRPRRFGKSLNMSMLKYFFEYGCNPALFEGLEIADEKEFCEQYMGKFPVLFISLKGVNGRTYEIAYEMFCSIIAREASKFDFLLSSPRLTETDKQQLGALIKIRDDGTYQMPESVLGNSLLTLSTLLHKHYNQEVIIFQENLH